MHIVILDDILPKEIRDNWITFQMLCNVLKSKRIFFLIDPLVTNYLYFFLDGEKQATLFNYIGSFHNSVWMMGKIRFAVDGNELQVFRHRQRRRSQLKRVRVKSLDLKSAEKFIEYLELF